MSDPINPDHYKFNGVEVIQLTEQLGFLEGNVVKYVARAGRKQMDPLEDLRKARWYLDRLIRNAEGTPETIFHKRIPTDGIKFGPFGVTDEQLALKPRKWSSLSDVPTGVRVTDKDGDHYVQTDSGWSVRDLSTGLAMNPGTFKSIDVPVDEMDIYGPFTEVIE